MAETPETDAFVSPARIAVAVPVEGTCGGRGARDGSSAAVAAADEVTARAEHCGETCRDDSTKNEVGWGDSHDNVGAGEESPDGTADPKGVGKVNSVTPRVVPVKPPPKSAFSGR